MQVMELKDIKRNYFNPEVKFFWNLLFASVDIESLDPDTIETNQDPQT